jgi:DNA-binding response OmpR family regulator
VKKVLIVDDSQAQAALTKSVLETAGYLAVALTDPMRIEQIIDVERPHLILLDVVMPQRNGFQASRRTRRATNFGGSSRARMATW